jgi:hypothetical protein
VSAQTNISQAERKREFYQFVDEHPQLSQDKIAANFGIGQATVSRWLSQRPKAPVNGTVPREAKPPTTALQRQHIAGQTVSPEPIPQHPDFSHLYTQLQTLRTEVAELKAHRVEVDVWIAALQAQSRDTAQTHAEVRSPEQRSLAQRNAEPAHTWDDPDDAKSVPFNLSLPRGLKRLLDAETKRTGLAASRLVQKLLMAALLGEEGRDG